MSGKLDDVHYAPIGEKRPDWWRVLADEPDPDDEELAETPPDVVAMLGFDPAKAPD